MMDGRYKAYAGVGNRDTPPEILAKMTEWSKKLSDLGFTLRTNGSDVPGDALELGANKVEYYLPWKNFNKKKSRYDKPTEDAYELASKYHIVFDKLNDTVKALVAANSHVILGDNLRDPVLFVLAWSPDGAELSKECTARTGIANQPIKIAASLNIPVFNLHKPDAEMRLERFLSQYR